MTTNTVKHTPPMTPTEKHRETAREVVMGWATSDGLVSLEDRVAAALANSEREGMRRAAEIAREYGDFEPDCPHGEGFWRACDNLAAAILSEAGKG